LTAYALAMEKTVPYRNDQGEPIDTVAP
jgi:hypothetical protein